MEAVRQGLRAVADGPPARRCGGGGGGGRRAARNAAGIAGDGGPGGDDVGDAAEEVGAGAGAELREGAAEGAVVGLQPGPVRRVRRAQPAPVAEEPVARRPVEEDGSAPRVRQQDVGHLAREASWCNTALSTP